MPKNKLKTPDWILKPETKPKKKTQKTFKIRKCPECKSDDVRVVIGENKIWECRKCKWKGADVQKQELNEEEFMKYYGEDVAPKGVPSKRGDINIEGKEIA